MTSYMSWLGSVQCHSSHQRQEITSADDSIKSHSRNKRASHLAGWSSDVQVQSVRCGCIKFSLMQGILVFPVISGRFSFLWLKFCLVVYDIRVVAIKQALWPCEFVVRMCIVNCSLESEMTPGEKVTVKVVDVNMEIKSRKQSDQLCNMRYKNNGHGYFSNTFCD